MKVDVSSLNGPNSRLCALRRKWISRFDISKKNSIAHQLTNVTWDITCFKILDEAAYLAPEVEGGGREINGAIFNLLARSFAKGLMADIRKLVDNRRDTVSLRRLIEEIRRERQLLTRKAILAVEEIDYDSKESQRKEDELFEEQARQGNTRMYGLPYAESPDRINLRHEQLDFLCRVAPQARKPTDRIDDRILKELINSIDTACGAIKNYVDENIAHASEGANKTGTLNKAPTWGAIYDAHRALCRVAGFVHLHVLGVSQLPFSPMPGYETLAHISRPLVAQSDVEAVYQSLQTFWQEWVELSTWKPQVPGTETLGEKRSI